MGHLMSHRAHSLRPIGARAYAPAGVRRENSKKLCELLLSEPEAAGSARAMVNLYN